MHEDEFKIEIENSGSKPGVVVRFIDRTWPDPSAPSPTYVIRKEQRYLTWSSAMMQAAAWIQQQMDD